MTTNNASNQNSIGIQSLNSSGANNGRTITGTSNQISVTNGDGTGGNPTLALTSTINVSGISFDSGSNTLSNYVQGTFTPTITTSGGGESVSYTTQAGRYTRIGNRVILDIAIVLSSFSGGSGNAQISSFPFTSGNNSTNFCGVNFLDNITFGASVTYYVINIAPNATIATLSGVRSATTILTLASTGLASTSQIRLSMVYEI